MAREGFPTIEIFGPTIQGEGLLCGHRSHFVRFGGCGYACLWCDSMHAVDPVQVKRNSMWFTAEEITELLKRLKPSPWVTLSGGDPLMWDLNPLIDCLHEAGFQVAVETQGQFYKDWLTKCDLVTVSPKGPSSGMTGKFEKEVLDKYFNNSQEHVCPPHSILKIVIFTGDDMTWARSIHKMFPLIPMWLSIGTPLESDNLPTDILEGLYQVTEALLKDDEMFNVQILPQMHALIWGHEKGK